MSLQGQSSGDSKRFGVFGLVFCALIFARGLPSWAEQTEKSYRIGFMSVRSERGPWDEALKLGLREFGYTEGKNVSLIYRWADGKFDRFPALAEDLVRQNVDIIVTETTPAAQAAKQATQNIPIVMAIGGDAVGAGLVASLARPGGNVTGQTFIGTDLAPKWLEKLKELAPRISRPAFLANSAVAPEIAFFKVMEPVARELGMIIKFVDINGFKQFRDAFREMKRSRHGPTTTLPPLPMAPLRFRAARLTATGAVTAASTSTLSGPMATCTSCTLRPEGHGSITT